MENSNLAEVTYSNNGEVSLSPPPYDRYLIVANDRHLDGNTTRIYDIEENTVVKEISQDGLCVSAIALLPNGHFVFGGQMADSTSTIRIYNPTDDMLELEISQLGGSFNAIAVLRDGNIVVGSRLADSTIQIYNPENGMLVREMPSNGISFYNKMQLQSYVETLIAKSQACIERSVNIMGNGVLANGLSLFSILPEELQCEIAARTGNEAHSIDAAFNIARSAME